MSKSKFVGVALATFVAASLMACGGGEEKETRTPSSSDKAAASEMGGDLAVSKSYVREKKADTLPPFIVVVGSNEAGSFFVQQKDSDEIIDGKATSKSGEDCSFRSMGGVSGLKDCGPNEVAIIEVTTKSSGKVTYKF